MEPITNATLLFADLAFRGWFPLWAAVLLGIPAAVVVVTLYRREAGRLPIVPRAVMAFLRVAVLSTILFLALRPTLVSEVRGERFRPVALLVDDSQSMLTPDPRLNFIDRWRTAIAFNLVAPDKPMPTMPTSADLPETLPENPTRLDLAKAALTNPRLQLLERLNRVGPLQPAAFGQRRTAKDPRDAKWVESLTGQEPRTALADAVFDLLRRDENELPAAVVLVTDGRENASDRGLDDLAAECARLEVPLHIYGVGSSSFGQLQVCEAIVPETLFVDDTVSVPIRYRVRGYKDGKVALSLKLNGQEVARKTVDLKEGEDLRDSLSFVPQQRDAQAGKQELVASVTIYAGPETVTDEITKSVRIIDQKVKVLVVESVPRWDFKFLQRALLRDRRVIASFHLTEGDPRAMRSGPPFVPQFPQTRQELFAYDLLILGDIPASMMTGEQQRMVRDFVAEGGGLIHIAGRNHGPASFVGTPLADVLPVEFQPVKYAIDSGDRPLSFRPELTPPGVRSPVLSLDDDPVENLRTWRELPEIYWSYPVTKLKPAAESFLVHPRERTTDGKPMPLLASHYYGKGYVVWVGFDETWRWRFNVADRFFGRFWSQAVYVAGVPRTLGTKLTQISLDTPDPLLGKTGQVYARLFTEDLQPLITDRLEARLIKLDAGPDDPDRNQPIELRALPGHAGEYIATIPFSRVGRYELRVDNAADTASLEYRVTLPPDHELAPGGMAEGDLRRLAEMTGGRFYHEEELHELPSTVKPRTVVFTRREEHLLWNEWALLAVIGLFTAEWFVRKFNSLS
jgi:uncharacterized membrane protein